MRFFLFYSDHIISVHPEWSTRVNCVRVQGDDIGGPHSTAVIVGINAVLGCAHSLDIIKDTSKSNTSGVKHYKYVEDYWIQPRITKNTRGEYNNEDRVKIRLHKFHVGNDWALFVRADGGSFLESEVAKIDSSLLSDPNIQLTHKKARVLHCPVSLLSSMQRVTNEFCIGYQISGVSVLGQSSHHLKYEGRDLCRGSSGGAVFVEPSGALLGMHSEVANEVDFEGEEEDEKIIISNDKQVCSEDIAHEEFDYPLEPNPKKAKTGSEESQESESVVSIAGGTNGLGSALIVCKFPRLMHYINELNNFKKV